MDTARVKQYFERIGLPMPQKIVPDAELLQQLTFHQIISIPFENTQLLIKKMVPCDVDSLFQRIVIEGKGGICHDIAGLFGWFLSELGYFTDSAERSVLLLSHRSFLNVRTQDCD